MHLLRCESVKYVNLRLTILARFISFKFRLSFALFSRCFSVRWTLSRTSCYLEKPENKDIKQVTEICFFHFHFVHNIYRCKFYVVHKTQHKHNTSQNFTPHTHSIICNGSFIIKNISLKIYFSKWESYLMYWNDVFKLLGIMCLWITTFRTIFIICKRSPQTKENRLVFSLLNKWDLFLKEINGFLLYVTDHYCISPAISKGG